MLSRCVCAAAPTGSGKRQEAVKPAEGSTAPAKAEAALPALGCSELPDGPGQQTTSL